MILNFSKLVYYWEGIHLSQGGVRFLVWRYLVNNVVKIKIVSNMVAYLIPESPKGIR